MTTIALCTSCRRAKNKTVEIRLFDLVSLKMQYFSMTFLLQIGENITPKAHNSAIFCDLLCSDWPRTMII